MNRKKKPKPQTDFFSAVQFWVILGNL